MGPDQEMTRALYELLQTALWLLEPKEKRTRVNCGSVRYKFVI